MAISLLESALREQHEDFDFARRQPVRTLAAAANAVAGGAEHRLDGVRVEAAGRDFAAQLRRGRPSASSAGRCARGSRERLIDVGCLKRPAPRTSVLPPVSPRGYPEPSRRSWCLAGSSARPRGATSRENMRCDQIGMHAHALHLGF